MGLTQAPNQRSGRSLRLLIVLCGQGKQRLSRE